MSGSRRQQESFGIPANFKSATCFPFAGVNQKDSRIGMEDAEQYWRENFVNIGKGKLRTMWDNGAPFYTVPSGKQIVYFFWFNIGPDIAVAVFHNDGTAVSVAWPTGVITTISDIPNTFYVPGSNSLPATVQSGTQYLLIANNNTTNDYWIWDGTVLYSAGQLAPFVPSDITSGGSDYVTVPNYTVFGGSGSGVVLTPIINEGSVVSLTINNPGSGYLPGEVVQVAFSGGGSDDTPILMAVLSSQPVSAVTLLSGGSGYTNGLNFALAFTGGGGGSGAAGFFDVVGGVVGNVRLTAGGTGYTATPGVSFAASGGGTGAAAVATLNFASVASVTVVNGGTNLQGTPVLTFVGGGGTGATAVAVMTGGVISSVTVTNAGTGYDTAPSIEVQSGLNNAASAILDVMPFGVSGNAIETWQQRIWLSNPHQVGDTSTAGTLLTSAPGSNTDFATADGGNIFTNTDRFLRIRYVFLRQTSNFLYLAGDSSVSLASNVQTQGNPPTTTFSYQNTDPQTGTPWRDTAQDFANIIVFANQLGVFGIYGGSVRKVSEKLDDVFYNAVYPPTAGALVPSAAVATVYNQKLYLLLLTIKDPFTEQTRNAMVFWDGKELGIASQTASLRQIGTREIDSDLTAWGSDGQTLRQLFQTPSNQLVKVISTKAFGGAQSWMINTSHSLYIDAVDKSAGQTGLSFSGSIDGIGMAVPAINYVTGQTATVPSGSYPFANSLTFVAPKPLGAVYGTGAGVGLSIPSVPAIGLGVTLATSSEDFELRNITLGYLEGPAFM